MKELQKELIELMKHADMFKGLHARVEEKRILTYPYLFRVRHGRVDIKDKPENVAKVRKLIRAYKDEINKAIQRQNLWEYS